MQIQYFERLNPEMECIYLLERRYQAGEDAPHSIPALRDYLSGKYNIPMFELEAMLQPLIDLENYVVSNLQVSEERLRFFFSSRGGTTSALARPLYAVLHSRPHYGSLPEAEKLGALKRVLARVLGLETEDLAGIDSFDARSQSRHGAGADDASRHRRGAGTAHRGLPRGARPLPQRGGAHRGRGHRRG